MSRSDAPPAGKNRRKNRGRSVRRRFEEGRAPATCRGSFARPLRWLGAEARAFYQRQPCFRKKSTISTHDTPKSLQTSGIFGFSKFPVAFSPVTTVSPRARASAITQGSQPDLFLLVSTSRPY